MNWTARYVGLPFKDGGRDFQGVDCWGLVRLVLAGECGIAVPSYGEISARDLSGIAGTLERQANAEPWLPILPQAARAFDVAVMRRRQAPIHVGILADERTLLHIEEATDAALVPLDHPTLRARLKTFYRHRDLV